MHVHIMISSPLTARYCLVSCNCSSGSRDVEISLIEKKYTSKPNDCYMKSSIHDEFSTVAAPF
jgi:hypothetical protein